jgi:hypothetical protein
MNYGNSYDNTSRAELNFCSLQFGKVQILNHTVTGAFTNDNSQIKILYSKKYSFSNL